MRLMLLMWLSGLAACASARPGRVVESWTAELGREHPLAGKVWRVGTGEFIPMTGLEDAVSKADLVLLGEVHDNPDHHRLQAALVKAAARGRRPVLAFEMIDADLQPKLDAAGGEPDEVARAVDWEKSGWPPFAMYRPIFEAAAEAKLPLVAANLSREETRGVVTEGLTRLDPALKSAVERHWPPPVEVIDARRDEMKAAHCGHFAEQTLLPMVLAQLSRDVHLARRLLETAGKEGGILIAGNGHTRSDWGVVPVLASDAPERSVVSVGILEVDDAATSPEAYAQRWNGSLPFDFVLFTPAVIREDPCELLRRRSAN